MSSVLTGMLVCAVVFLAAVMISERRAAGRKRTVVLNVDEDSDVKVDRDPEGITVRVRYATFEDRPDDAELFPDIVNEPVRSDHALDEIFWRRLANIDSLEAQDRKALLDKLCEHGFIRSTELSRMSFMEGGGDFRSAVELGQDIPEEDIGHPVFPEDFYKPFNY